MKKLTTELKDLKQNRRKRLQEENIKALSYNIVQEN